MVSSAACVFWRLGLCSVVLPRAQTFRSWICIALGLGAVHEDEGCLALLRLKDSESWSAYQRQPCTMHRPLCVHRREQAFSPGTAQSRHAKQLERGTHTPSKLMMGSKHIYVACRGFKRGRNQAL